MAANNGRSKDPNAQTKALVHNLRGALLHPQNVKTFSELIPQTLARHLTPERVSKIVLGAASRNQKLLECTTASIVKSVCELLAMGLEPGSPLGEGYLVPFWNSKIGANEATAIPGYRGYIVLARRSGQIRNVCANIVYERDAFEIDLASSERPSHKPCFKGDRGDPICVYAIADFVDGGHHIEFMTVGDVNAIRARSKSAYDKNGNPSGPWATDWGQMARKTVIRRASKYWPLSIEMANALELDDRSGRIIDGGELEPTLSFDAVESPAEVTTAQSVLGMLQEKAEEPVELVGEHEEDRSWVAAEAAGEQGVLVKASSSKRTPAGVE